MPYRRHEDRRAAERRYEASPKGKATRRARDKRERSVPINPRPLERAFKQWGM